MPGSSSRLRQSAIQALDKWGEGHVYAETLVARNAENLGLSKSNRGLLNAIVLGVLRNLRLLDFWISLLRPEGRLDLSTRNALRVGLVQLLILDVSEHAAVNETVEGSPRKVRGLVNGVLRSALRRKQELLDKANEQVLPVRLSHPDWLVSRWEKCLNFKELEALLTWNSTPSPVFVRANGLRSESLRTLQEAENTHAVPDADEFFELSGPIPKDWLKDGLIYVQDPATRHCIDLLAPRPGEAILDACAAPGGKAALILSKTHGQAQLTCTDSNAKRLPRLEENLKRLGADQVTTFPHDWTKPAPASLHEQFDAILLDVPCSNTGVLRRRVDARWRLTAESITEVTKIQRQILENALPCLRPGGRIVYSTCSIDPEENRGLIDAFCTDHPEVRLAGDVQIFPHQHGTDGAYAARLELN